MSRILIVYQSRHGSTKDIANTIAARLKKAEHSVNVFEKPFTAPVPIGYDVVILGSATYLGRWLAGMRRYYLRNRELLSAVNKVWLFSSGPVGEQDNLAYNTPTPVDEIKKQLHVQDHVVFSGKLDRKNLSLSELVATKIVKASPGDFRNWDAISKWADDIADSLQ